MSNIYGLPNIVVAEVMSKLFQHEHLCKFLYYTDEDSKTKSILDRPKVSTSKIVGKNVFIGRRIPNAMLKSGAYLCIRVFKYDVAKKSKLIKEIQVDIDIICHQDCQSTIHGTRDITLVTMIHDALEDEFLCGIGECRVIATGEILGLDVGYDGYRVRVSVVGFSNEGIPNDNEYQRLLDSNHLYDIQNKNLYGLK